MYSLNIQIKLNMHFIFNLENRSKIIVYYDARTEFKFKPVSLAIFVICRVVMWVWFLYSTHREVYNNVYLRNQNF